MVPKSERERLTAVETALFGTGQEEGLPVRVRKLEILQAVGRVKLGIIGGLAGGIVVAIGAALIGQLLGAR